MSKKSLVVGLALLLTVGFFGANQWERIKDASLIQRCTFQGLTDSYDLSPEQAGNAATIAVVASRRGLPKRATTVALAAALQESKLRILNYGDRDSVGLFQQRPSQGWGPEASLMDPVYSTSKFFSALIRNSDWQQLSIADAAQAVQRSAAGNAYAAWESEARVLSEILMSDPFSVTCYLHRFASAPTSAKDRQDSLAADLKKVFGLNNIESQSSKIFSINVKDPKHGLVAAWLVTHADEYGIAEIEANHHSWARGEWKNNSANTGDISVRFI